MILTLSKIAFLVLSTNFLFAVNYYAISQEADTTTVNETPADTSQINDTTDVKQIDKKSDLKTKVIYSAKDSAVFIPGDNSLRLRGDAKVDYGEDKLEAELILFNFGESTLDAYALKDSNGRYYGFPKYNQQQSEYYAKKLTFNFKTQKGIISSGETEMSEGFYFGEKIKRVGENELFVQDGFYTTCDAPQPHYYFGSSEMKVVRNDRVFIDPLVFYVEDVPVFIYPFGVFFPDKGGRQSGIIVPSFAFSAGRGVIFEGLGYYWAASDYYDMQFSTDLYSKGGYLFKNKTRWNVKDEYNGSANIEYGRTRFNTDEEFVTAWRFTLDHRQTITPYQNLSANLNFTSSDFNRNTSANINERIQQSITSNASYNLSFDDGSNLSMGYTREQNIINDTYSQSAPLSYSIPNKKLFSFLDKDVTFRNSSRINYNHSKNLNVETDINGNTDTSFTFEERKYISHSPSISFNLPRFYNFNLTPSVGFGANHYFRKMTKTYNEETEEVEESFEQGFFTEYYYNYGVNLQTRIYGIANFGEQGLKAFRHTFEPNISYRINPDFSDRSFGFYDSYYDPRSEREVQYNRFEADGGSHASSSLQQNLGIDISNRFEAKIQDDTTETNLELLQWDLRTNYNFAADSLKWSDVSMSFRTPAVSFVNFSGNASFTLYDEAEIRDDEGNVISNQKIDEFLFENDKGIARMTNLSLTLGTSFDSEGVQIAEGFGEENVEDDTTETESTIGERFSRRFNTQEEDRNLFGECHPGYQNIGIPWSMNFSLSYRYSQPFVSREPDRTVSLNTSLRFQLTETWRFDANGIYDIIENELQNSSINITKDMHCWELSLRWYPIGVNRGFYLKFGIKASQLQDLKLEKRDDPIYR